MRSIKQPPAPGTWDDSLIRRMILVRIVATYGLAAATAAIPVLGPDRFLLALVMAGPVPILTMVILRLSASDVVLRNETVADIGWTLVAIEIVPEVFGPAALVSMAMLAFLAQEDQPILVIPATLGAVGLAALGWIHDVALWQPVVAAYALMIPLHFFVARTQAERSRRFEEEIRHRMAHDPLTGLRNRIGLAEEFASAAPLAVIVVDLDGFKEVNDTLGHESGDELLRLLSERMAEVTAGSGVIARIGGDEFAIAVFSGNPDLVAGRALRACQRRVALSDIDVSVGASIGVAASSGGEVDGPELLRRADLAMYEAKRGQGGVKNWTVRTNTASRERMALSGEVDQGFERGEFELYFQPMIQTVTDRVVGLEGLLRWNHPTRGLLPPGDWLQLVEGIGRRSTMDRVVFEQAAVMAAEVAGSGIGVSVNVSAGSLLRSSLPVMIEETLSRHAVSPTRITVEVLEDQMVDDQPTARAVIAALGESGIGIAIDDFGTGHSSMSRLRRMPVTSLKIDRSFVMSMLTSLDDEAIVSAAAGLGRALELTVVAEGVEDMAVRDRIIERGYAIDNLQGFGIARPMPAAKVTDWIECRIGRLSSR